MNPLVLTLTLDDAAFHLFDALRQQHFPPARNFLAAHLTLFHALPGESAEEIQAMLQNLSAHTAAFSMNVSGLMLLGRGVAYRIHSAELIALHHGLQQVWQPWLSPQDSQPLRPHITVQNKVTPDTAKQLLQDLTGLPYPEQIMATGFVLWEYLGGPWREMERFNFLSSIKS